MRCRCRCRRRCMDSCVPARMWFGAVVGWFGHNWMLNKISQEIQMNWMLCRISRSVELKQSHSLRLTQYNASMFSKRCVHFHSKFVCVRIQWRKYFISYNSYIVFSNGNSRAGCVGVQIGNKPQPSTVEIVNSVLFNWVILEFYL